MLNATPTVRVVIPCRNEADYIAACIGSIIDADRSGMFVEVDVCDGMSDDGTRAILQQFAARYPWIRIVDNTARSTPHALNLGLRRPGYDVGIILGAHAEVGPRFFQANIDTLRQHPDVGCAGGVIENVYADDASRAIGTAMAHPFGVGSAYFRTGRKDGLVDTVAFGAYRREVFDRVGYFDERLVRNQDDEFNYRVTKAGFGIFLSHEVHSKYSVRASIGKLFRQYFQYGYWKVFVNRIHGTVTTWRQLVPAVLVLFIVLGIPLGMMDQRFGWIWVAGTGAYLIALSLASVHAGRSAALIPRVFVAFIALHFAYGSGYIKGIWDLLLLRRDPSERSKALTR